jgi:hypothetical protein
VHLKHKKPAEDTEKHDFAALTVKFKMQPPINYKLITFDPYHSQFVLEKSALAVGTSYAFEVNVSNNTAVSSESGQCAGCAVTQTLRFETEEPPRSGNMSVTPGVGLAEVTEFEVNLDGWHSRNYPLNVTFTCQKTVIGSISMTKEQSTFNRLFTKLPVTSMIEATLVDSLGQIAVANVKVVVNEPLHKPSGGSVRILPSKGYAQSTLFTLSVGDDWHLDGQRNLQYRFWGLRTLNEHEDHIALTEPYPYSGHQSNHTMRLPNIVAVDAQVFGTTGESAYYRVAVSVANLLPPNITLSLESNWVVVQGKTVVSVTLENG